MTAYFNSQPPEGGWRQPPPDARQGIYFNSQPPEGGWYVVVAKVLLNSIFQLTAARRRLV